jgi:hypothetical protein
MVEYLPTKHETLNLNTTKKECHWENFLLA